MECLCAQLSICCFEIFDVGSYNSLLWFWHWAKFRATFTWKEDGTNFCWYRSPSCIDASTTCCIFWFPPQDECYWSVFFEVRQFYFLLQWLWFGLQSLDLTSVMWLFLILEPFCMKLLELLKAEGLQLKLRLTWRNQL